MAQVASRFETLGILLILSSFRKIANLEELQSWKVFCQVAG